MALCLGGMGWEEEAGLDPHEDHVAFARLLGAVQKRYCILLFMRLQRDTNHGVELSEIHS